METTTHDRRVCSFLSPMIRQNLQEARLNWPLSTTNSLLGTQQVYLLTPMDLMTPFIAKLTMSHCQPSLITSQRASVNGKLLYRDREKSVRPITTYLNDNAQTPLIDLLSIRYTTNFATNTVTNRTDRVHALVYGSTSVDRRRWDKQWSIVDLIDPMQLAACSGEILSKSTVVQTKIGHVSKNSPTLVVIFHPFGKWYNLPLYKIWELYLQPFLRYGRGPKN